MGSNQKNGNHNRGLSEFNIRSSSFWCCNAELDFLKKRKRGNPVTRTPKSSYHLYVKGKENGGNVRTNLAAAGAAGAQRSISEGGQEAVSGNAPQSGGWNHLLLWRRGVVTSRVMTGRIIFLLPSACCPSPSIASRW